MKIQNDLEQIPVLTVLTVFFILGILIADFISIPIFILLASGCILLILAFFLRKDNLKFLSVLLALSLVTGTLCVKNYLHLAGNHIALCRDCELRPIRIQGIITSDPSRGLRKTIFNFKTEKIISDKETQDIQGTVLAQVFAGGRFSYGDELILEGNLRRPFNYTNSRNFSYREYLKRQGVYYILSIKKGNKIIFIKERQGSPLVFWAFRIKHKLMYIFDKYLWPKNAQVLKGIVLGERQNFPEDIRQAFVQTGTAHIIAISGFNVGIIVFILLIFLKVLRIKRTLRYIVAIPILIIHCIAVGAGPSVVRATIMAIALLMSYLISREAHIINSLSLSALIILAFNPLQVFDAGFQLSFVSVLAIVILSPKIAGLFKTKPKGSRLFRVIIDGFSVSLSAWLVTSGFIAYYFRIISPITILANLIIVPLTSLVITVAFSLCLAGLLFAPLAYPVASTANFIMALLFKSAIFFSRIPFAYFYF